MMIKKPGQQYKPYKKRWNLQTAFKKKGFRDSAVKSSKFIGLCNHEWLVRTTIGLKKRIFRLTKKVGNWIGKKVSPYPLWADRRIGAGKNMSCPGSQTNTCGNNGGASSAKDKSCY